MKKLSPKERRFVAEYMKDENGTQAAIRAGYAKPSAVVTASRLLRKAHVRAAVDAKLKKIDENIEQKVVISKEWVLSNLKEVAERSLQHVPVMEFDHVEKAMVQKTVVKIDPVTGKFLKEVGVFEFDSSGANRSLELIGKHLKMFTDKVEVSDPQGIFERLERGRRNASGRA